MSRARSTSKENRPPNRSGQMSGKEAAQEVLRELSGGSRRKGTQASVLEESALNRSLLLHDFMQSRSHYNQSLQPPAFMEGSQRPLTEDFYCGGQDAMLSERLPAFTNTSRGDRQS